MLKPVVIIGGGPTGMSAASQIKRRMPEKDVIVFEKGGFISYGACGMPYYISGEIKDYHKLIILPPEKAIKERNIDVRLYHEVVKIEPKHKKVLVKAVKEKDKIFEVEYDRLVIGSGARPLMPKIDGVDTKGVFLLKELTDAIAINEYIKEKKPKRGVIIGGGFIGVEAAEAFFKQAMEVTLIEAASRILTVLDEDFSNIVKKGIEQNGVRIITGARVSRIEREDGFVKGIVLDNGAMIEADIVLISIGVRPNSELAKEAGIEVGDRDAVKVDRYLRTSDECIFAGGDCATVYHSLLDRDLNIPLALGANRQGRVCGENIVRSLKGKRLEEFPAVFGTSMTKTFEWEIAKTGIGEVEIKKYGLKNIGSTMIKYFAKAGYYPERSRIWIRLYFNKDDKKIVGAQIVGNDGSALRINTVVAAMYMGATLKDLYNMDFGYCPPFSPVWDPLLIAARQGIKTE